MRYPTVFLDRDGVLNDDRVAGDGWVLTPSEMVLLPGAAEAVARLNRAGCVVIVVTNQSCVGRGLLDRAALGAIHDRLRAELARAGAHLDAIYTCPHRPDDGCACRKPRPGLLLRAAAERPIDFSRAVMIGDRQSDLEAAARVGCAGVLVLSGAGLASLADPSDSGPRPVHTAADLAAAVDWVLA